MISERDGRKALNFEVPAWKLDDLKKFITSAITDFVDYVLEMDKDNESDADKKPDTECDKNE